MFGFATSLNEGMLHERRVFHAAFTTEVKEGHVRVCREASTRLPSATGDTRYGAR
jgi:hypothetical protein